MSTATQTAITETDSSSIFEFDFVEQKPSTKVDSVFDLVNGNGQHATNPNPKRERGNSQVIDEAASPDLINADTVAHSPWSTEPEGRLQAADSALEAAIALDDLQSPNHEELILTQSEVIDGATSTTLIKSPDIFEFDHSETLEPAGDLERLGLDGYIDSVNSGPDKKDAAKQQQELDELESDYQAKLKKWEREYEQAKVDWENQKYKTEQEQIALALEVKRISDELKEVRQSHKSVIATLQDLNKVGPDYPERPVKGKPVPKPNPSNPSNLTAPSTSQPVGASPGSHPTQSVSEGPAKPNTDETWRIIKSETFLTLAIEGMGQKKLDTILHEYPTLGDLVDLQTEASKKCLHLCKLLPKGVGKKLADSIDNAVMDAFAKHSQPV